jgi:MFS family permease
MCHPFIQKDLGGGADDVAWVSTAYSLGLAVFVPTSNWLANRVRADPAAPRAMIGFLTGYHVVRAGLEPEQPDRFRVLRPSPAASCRSSPSR